MCRTCSKFSATSYVSLWRRKRMAQPAASTISPLASSSEATARNTLTWPLRPRQAGPTWKWGSTFIEKLSGTRFRESSPCPCSGNILTENAFIVILCLNAGAKLAYDLLRGAESFIGLRDLERNGAYPGVASSAITLADLGQVDRALRFGPGVRAYRHLHPKSAFAYAHAIDG